MPTHGSRFSAPLVAIVLLVTACQPLTPVSMRFVLAPRASKSGGRYWPLRSQAKLAAAFAAGHGVEVLGLEASASTTRLDFQVRLVNQFPESVAVSRGPVRLVVTTERGSFVSTAEPDPDSTPTIASGTTALLRLSFPLQLDKRDDIRSAILEIGYRPEAAATSPEELVRVELLRWPLNPAQALAYRAPLPVPR